MSIDSIIGGISLASIFIYGIYYCFRPQINKIIATEATAIATEVVKSSDIQNASEILVKELLNQKNVKDETNKFVISMISDPTIQLKLVEVGQKFINSILQDEVTYNESKKFIMKLSDDQSVKEELKKLMLDLIKDDESQKVLIDLVINLLNDVKTQKEFQNFIVGILRDEIIKKNIVNFLTNILENDEIKQSIQKSLITILRDIQIKNEVYATLKGLLDELTKDDAIKKLLVEFIGKTFMDALNEPVNDKYIKDKVIELLTAPAIMDAVSIALMDVVQREDLKKTIGDSAIIALTTAIKKNYPRSYGKLV